MIVVFVLYFCPVCGWIGTEPALLSGSWDYELHESCPVCWENEVDDNPVQLIYLGKDEYDR